MRFLKRFLGALLAGLMALPLSGLAENLHAELANDALSVQVTVGYEGIMTYGKTMPIFMRLENEGADIEGKLCVNIYANRRQYNRYEMELSLAAGTVKDVRLPVRVSSKQDTYTVEIWQGGEKICAVNAAPLRTVNPNAMLVGVLADQPLKFSYMDVDANTDSLMRGEYIKTVPLTAETFPDSPELMNAFGMLAVDGFDVSILSSAQQSALQSWLDQGHILLLGGGAGAAAAWPAFRQMTGVHFARAEKADDPTEAMLAYLGVAGEAAGQTLMLARAVPDASEGLETVIQSGDEPILWRAPAAENSVIYTCSFSLADQALVSWAPMHTFFQQLLIKDSYTLYQRGFGFRDVSEGYTGFARGLLIENDVPILTAALAAAAILLLGGGAAYLILRRLDRRQYLWLALPALSLLAAAAVILIGVGSRAARPTVLGVTVLRQGTDGTQKRVTSLAAAVPGREEQVYSVEEGTLALQDNGWYYYDEEEKAAVPTKMQYRYIAGQKNSVGVTPDRAWTSQSIAVNDLPGVAGRIEASLWMEEDGLHGTIMNGTGLALEAGVFCCKYGYCSVPALASGQQFDLYMRKAAFADEKDRKYEDGCMYESLGGSGFSAYSMVYEYYGRGAEDYLPEWDASGRDSAHANLMASALSNYSDGDYSSRTAYMPRFYYAAYTDGLSIPEVYVNGEAVTRKSELALVCASIPITQRPDSALIYRVPGMDETVRCQADANGVPFYDAAAAMNSSYYHPLIEQPVFMIQVKEAVGAKIERLVFYSEYLSSQAQAYLYNGSEWLPYVMGKDVENPEQYIDAEGRAFIQFRPVTAVEYYYDVYTPTMLLEGRME